MMWTCPQCRARYAEGRFCPLDGAVLGAAVEPARPRRDSDGPAVPGVALERELGRGLTGAVWQGRRLADGRAVAVKLLHREWAGHAEMRERFAREAAAARAIDHPGVVAPLAAGELADGRPYLVMDLVDGPALEEVLALGPLPEERAAGIGADVADALAAVHAAGVIHRDVKPGNLRIGRDGRTRLLDFGVARRLDLDEPRLTQGGLAVGTPHYMAPEQCTGDPQSGRTDVYALGCVLYRMLSGEVPFEGAAVAVMLAHAGRDPVPLRERAPAVSAPLAALVMRCLAKRAGDRPDARELAEQLAVWAGRAPAGPEATRVRLGRAATVPAPEPGATRADAEAAGAVDRGGGASLPARSAARAREAAPSWLPSDDATTAVVQPVRRRRLGRWLAGVLALAAGLLVFNATEVGHRLAHRAGLHLHPRIPLAPFLAGPRPAVAAPRPIPPPPVEPGRQYLVAADAGVALRLGAPGEVRAGVDHDLTVEVWDRDGAPLDTTDLVVTFAGPEGALVGFAAEPTRAAGAYRLRTRFAAPGAWIVRVFPPVGDAMVVFHLEVGEAAGEAR
jgi:eukaryotic-like serine/threonine-protein kinase